MKNIKLNDDQLKALSEITSDIGQAVFASAIIPFAFQLDKVRPTLVALALIVAVGCWVITVYLLKGKK